MRNIFWYEPKMTSNTTPTPYVASASSNYNGATPSQIFQAFDGSFDTFWGTISSTVTGWIKLDFGKSTKVDSFRIVANDNTAPKNLVLYGSNDDVNYVSISSISNQTGWTLDQPRTFNLENSVHYRYYRLNITSNNGNTISSWIYELSFGRYAEQYMILKNTLTSKYYSLNNKELIHLLESSNKNIVLYGIEAGKEIILDEDFNKMKFTQNTSEVLGEKKTFKHSINEKVNKIILKEGD